MSWQFFHVQLCSATVAIAGFFCILPFSLPMYGVKVVFWLLLGSQEMSQFYSRWPCLVHKLKKQISRCSHCWLLGYCWQRQFIRQRGPVGLHCTVSRTFNGRSLKRVRWDLRHTHPALITMAEILIIIAPPHGSCRQNIDSKLAQAFTSWPFLTEYGIAGYFVFFTMTGNLFAHLEGMND